MNGRLAREPLRTHTHTQLCKQLGTTLFPHSGLTALQPTIYSTTDILYGDDKVNGAGEITRIHLPTELKLSKVLNCECTRRTLAKEKKNIHFYQ